MHDTKPVMVNGWTLLAHPLFMEQIEALVQEVSTLKKKSPVDYKKRNASKRLAAIYRLAFEIIPQNPNLPEYRQGDTLGAEYKHWFRAKFFQQYRLFFRFHSEARIIVYTWVNDTETLRAYDSKTDAYKIFGKMLATGNPPDSWDDLIKAAKNEQKTVQTIFRI